MNISKYIEQNSTTKPPKAPIVERWNKRVVPRGLCNLGRKGAVVYLESYGKNISSKKVIELAQCAQYHGCADMANGFWEEAYAMDTGLRETADGGSTTPREVVANISTAPHLSEFPDDMQPGRINTMQPVDSEQRRSYFINSDEYYGQPKRNGIRNVIFVTKNAVVHQSRSTSILPPIGHNLEEALMDAADDDAFGPFIMDGERYYRSVDGSEHISAAQAAMANMQLEQGDVQPVVVYAVFRMLYFGCAKTETYTYQAMHGASETAVRWINESSTEEFNPKEVAIEFLMPAITKEEKAMLVMNQQSAGREGEVWTRKACRYTGGKSHDLDMVRTKYLEESIVKVDKMIPSTVPGSPFSALEVSIDGVSVGKVGTGWSEEDKIRLAERINNGELVFITVKHQGWTVGGKLWHARA